MTEREQALSHARLLEVLDYDRDTGIFRWRVSTSNRVKIGQVCGQIDKRGHRYINVDGWRYAAHRLAWFYVYERWPIEEIDHENLMKDDNWIANLREATRTGNCRNVGKKSHNKSGFKGVCRHSQARDKFMAQITIGGRPKYLWLFDNPEDAHAAYVAASAEYHGSFGRPN